VIYHEYRPSEQLAKYIKCYYSIECTDNDIIEDKAFASGCLEIMFTLNGSPWQAKKHETFTDTSSVGLWGQILDPLTFRSTGRSEIFGVRFYPAAALFLLKEDISRFNDGVFDLSGVLGKTITELHSRLRDEKSIDERIKLADAYLAIKLSEHPKALIRIDLVQRVMNEVTHRDFFDNIENVASRYGITSRYLQKIFVQYTGLTPKLFARINRFQNSLVLMGKGNVSLTDASYECGYFDQSHFIREFKSFTGLSPSAFMPESSTAILASPNKDQQSTNPL
jgi:AraC-like DNA-binding protein